MNYAKTISTLKYINDKFNNLEGINELDNCMKQLDYLLAKSKEISIKNKMNEKAKNQQFYISENEKIFIIIKIITIQMEKKT